MSSPPPASSSPSTPPQSKIRYALKDSPIHYLTTPSFLYNYFHHTNLAPCSTHLKDYLALFDICREFYDLRREENMRNIPWQKGDIRPRIAPLSQDRVEEGLALFGDYDQYRKICNFMVDSFDACVLHEMDGYARQCLDMHLIDKPKKWYHLQSCIRDRDINLLYKMMYQRTVRLLDTPPDAPEANIRGTLYKDISSYQSQCDILKQKYENCLLNRHTDQCAAEEFKYVACVEVRDCERELNACGEAFAGAHNGDRSVSRWHCLEYGADRDLGSAIPNIEQLNSCLMSARRRAMEL